MPRDSAGSFSLYGINRVCVGSIQFSLSLVNLNNAQAVQPIKNLLPHFLSTNLGKDHGFQGIKTQHNFC